MRLKFQSVTPVRKWISNWGLLLVLLTFFLYSCTAVGSGSIPESGQNRVISNVPFHAQEDYQCGPASLAGVMNYWKIDVTPDEIAKEIYSKFAKGTLSIDMIIYPQKKGLSAEQYSGNMRDLRKNIDSGYPLIVFVDYGFWVFELGHFMVVVGYNEDGVIVNSGKDEGKFISEKDFIKTWERTKFWTLLIKSKQINSK